jgi:hypothetical protein
VARRGYAHRMRRAHLIAVPLVLLVALVVVIALSGARTRRASPLERVAAHPERYDGSRLTITGRVIDRPDRVPPGMLGAFVLSGAGGRRLLVVPKRHGVLPLVSAGTRVTVRGEVVALDPWADDRGGDGPRDPVAIGDVAARAGAQALLEADRVQPARRGAA